MYRLEAPEQQYVQDQLRLEAVTVSVGFDDLLDFTLSFNHAHFDTIVVVTSHGDARTWQVAQKHGCLCVQTDLFQKNGRKFNKGAAINAGFGYWQYFGWRVHLDADIVVPDKLRQTLFNHTHLEKDCLYGADRVDVVGDNHRKLKGLFAESPQHRLKYFVDPSHGRALATPLGGRLVSMLDGYMPMGFFQLWHASCQKQYPYSLGTAEHDDSLFSALWPAAKRRLLPTVVCYHVCPETPTWGQNWDGRRTRRLK
jgi:hypothetical protein